LAAAMPAWAVVKAVVKAAATAPVPVRATNAPLHLRTR
jgi:hypothetical protein